VSANPFLRRELEQLRKFSTLGKRVSLDVVSKRVMARRFWQEMQGRLRRQGWHHLFFESGSTVAYLTDEFERTVLRADGESHPWQIRTNNVLAAVQFDLHTPVEASRFPVGVPDPEDRYGAIFPNAWHTLLEPVPKTPRVLFEGEEGAVAEMRDRFAGGTDRRQLVLATASGLDLDNRETAFRGPHVGSHPNMLFKRAILTAGDPVVLFLNAEKLGDPFRRGRCYPVFDPGLPWEVAAREFPLALCVGYEWPKTSPSMPRIAPSDLERRNQPGVIRSNLEDLGFEVTYFDDDAYRVSEVSEGGAILMGNRKFAEMVPGD
ncbi:MAG: hypothetical protein KDL87_10880, partial [Verrucomicrobiae bacterium]|nr:hypothetical protein [Verrucomicrobiae bacterium]